jgi:hypothetical protein
MRKTPFALVALAVLVAAVSSLVTASVTFTPPASTKPMSMGMIQLAPQSAAPKSSGMASLMSDKAMTKCTFVLMAKGLNPKSVYTVWFASPVGAKTRAEQMKMQGIGTAPYTLKVDSKGNAKLVSQSTSCSSVTKWQKVEIVSHPDKNPKNLAKSVPVLVGDLTKLK